MQPMLNIAVRAARNAGKIIARAYEQLDLVQAELKGTNDFVTNVDKEAEDGIRDRSPSRGLGDVYKRQKLLIRTSNSFSSITSSTNCDV